MDLIPRVAVLPRHGPLLVSGDLHGNGSDLRALVGHFEEELLHDPGTCWVILGDAIHGPDENARDREPELYDFPDESWHIIKELGQLRERLPANVYYVLGNHDLAHIGGPRTRKFHADEAAHLESLLSEEERVQLRSFFLRSHLAVVAPCGVLLTHGSPDDRLRSLESLGRIELPLRPAQAYEWGIVTSFLTSYGQPPEVTERLLATVRKSVPGIHLVVHGHDRDVAGYFTEGGNQVCPVLFGAPRANKRYLRLDLAASYRTATDLREGVEILKLHC
jgi:predicted phosphodiesterase